ncbi:hypothetical protein NMY22_g6754 [Coprinellus aureogranulatus]|nr:hypothetical protein NMY22_g6754 [Coprinellus aureogranulatus]
MSALQRVAEEIHVKVISEKQGKCEEGKSPASTRTSIPTAPSNGFSANTISLDSDENSLDRRNAQDGSLPVVSLFLLGPTTPAHDSSAVHLLQKVDLSAHRRFSSCHLTRDLLLAGVLNLVGNLLSGLGLDGLLKGIFAATGLQQIYKGLGLDKWLNYGTKN